MAKANLAVVARSAVASESPEVAERGRPRVAGKFFFHNGEKVFVRGVTYGPFTAGTHGARFPERDQVEHDFAAMRELGANCVRTFTPPPRWMLDLAAESGLWVLVGIAGPASLLSRFPRRRRSRTDGSCATACAAIAGHRAILAYLIGNEIPPDIVRWCGPERMREFLRCWPTTFAASIPDASGQLRELPVDRVSRRRLHRFRLLQRLPPRRGRLPPLPRAACRTSPRTSRWC